MGIEIIRDASDQMMKSGLESGELVRIGAVRRRQVSRDPADATAMFFIGGSALAMKSEAVEVLIAPDVLAIVRARLMETNPGALPALDAGTIDEHVLLRTIPEAVEVRAGDPEPEPLMKSGELHQFVRDGDGSCLECFGAEGDERHRPVKKAAALVPGRYPSVGCETIRVSAEEMRKGEADRIVREADAAWRREGGAGATDSMTALRKSAAELSVLVERIENSR